MTKILVTDDSETLRNQLRDLLEGEGFTVLEAINGLDGLEKLKSNENVSLIFCDVNMPEMDGITMCEEVHKIPNLNSIPIIMLTTEADAEMKRRAKAAGVIAWVTKPLNSSNLTTVVKKLLGK